eukprot:Colp12_sorted_trinity150504_noHs@24728
MVHVVVCQSNMESLLDFSQKLDIDLLEQVVETMHNGTGPQQAYASNILTRMKENPDAWMRVDMILELSKRTNTKYYALQILEDVIQTRWKALPMDQREGIKKYI